MSERSDTELAEVVKMYSENLEFFNLKGQLLLLPQPMAYRQSQWGSTLKNLTSMNLATFTGSALFSASLLSIIEYEVWLTFARGAMLM